LVPRYRLYNRSYTRIFRLQRPPHPNQHSFIAQGFGVLELHGNPWPPIGKPHLPKPVEGSTAGIECDYQNIFFSIEYSGLMIHTLKGISSRTAFFRQRLAYSKFAPGINLLETQKTYQPAVVEDPKICAPIWQATLKERKWGKSKDREKFSIILPPPNITGDLHLGHALTVSIQDAICRWQFMRGKDVSWIPGLDHAGLAAEMVVEHHLANLEKNKENSVNLRHTLGREAFIKEIWKWKESKSNTILDQLNRLGLLLDWHSEYFTFTPEHSKAVNEALFRFSEAGLLYRANSLISWCCHLQSAISDIEVDRKEITEFTKLTVPGYAEKQEFGYVDVFNYKLIDRGETVPVATTRLETMLGDTALAVHPDDSRYAHLIGKRVEHPFIKDRVMPIIADADHVDPNQGTGVVKVSPGHSAIDFEIAQGGKRLEVLNILSNDGSILPSVCEEFGGLPRFTARSKIAQRLFELGFYRGRYRIGESTEFLATVCSMSLPICSRSGDIVEPLLREQWFIDTMEMASAASKANETGEIRISPHFHEPTWRDWLSPERRRDWCISRQVWWGHRMPAYRIPDSLRPSKQCESNSSTTTSDWVIARDFEEARRLIAKRCNCDINEVPTELEQDTDVLDTWFSSGLLPMTAFGWPEKSSELERNYPLDLMETGQDILFFWVARMAMLGVHLTGRMPFKHILLHGLVCDANGQKMSKSKGNTIDPLSLIDGVGSLKPHQVGDGGDGGIQTLGADALRASLLATDFTRPAVIFTEEGTLDFRRFGNKIWQSLRFLISEMNRIGVFTEIKHFSIEEYWENLSDSQSSNNLPLIDEWILMQAAHLAQRFNSTFDSLCAEGNEDEALHNCVADFRLWWIEDLCSVYLEVIKDRLRSNNGSAKELNILIATFLCGLRLLHPLMPHLSEVLWQSLTKDGHSILLQDFPKPKQEPALDQCNFVTKVLDAMSKLKSWRVLLGLKKNFSGRVGVTTLLYKDPRKEAAIFELSAALTGLKPLQAGKDQDYCMIPCGAGITLSFEPEGVNFEAAKDTLQGRLTRLSKKVDVLHKKKQKQSDSTISNDLSRTEVSKVGEIPVFAAFKNI
uniref:valine--tRNA ligase n=1 Tax=Hymenolepis diminuta TaxID=6216 RepID=A0A158QGC2_HYMDI